MKSTAKEARARIQQFIMDRFEAYEEDASKVSKKEFCEVANYIMNSFYIEKVKHDRRNKNRQELFIEWTRELPSVLCCGWWYSESAIDLVANLLDQDASKYPHTYEQEEKSSNYLSYLIYRELSKYEAYGFRL